MQTKKITTVLLLSVISLGILGFTTTTHASWDVTGYQNYGKYDFEYTDKSSNGILTNRVNKSTPPLDIKSGVQQLRFLPGAKNYKDYMYISTDGGESFQPIGEPNKSDEKKGEYIYTTNIVKGTIIKIKNVSFVNGYNLDANILIQLNGRVTIKTNATDSLFNYDVGFYDGPPNNESWECLALYLSDSRNDQPIPAQEGKYFMLSYRDGYFKGYDAGYKEPITAYSDNLKYYQVNNDRTTLMDKSLMTKDISYSTSNYISHYSGTIEYLKYAYVDRLLFFKVGDPLLLYASQQDGMVLRTNSLFYNTKSTMIPEPYENTTISSEITADGKYNAEYTIKQTFPRQSNAAYYPENGIEIIPDLSNNDVKNITLESIITDKGNVVNPSDYQINEGTNSILFPVETLKKLDNETILIKYKTDIDYANDENLIPDFYNQEKHTFDIPFKVDVKIKFANVFDNQLEETANIEYPLDITVKSKELVVNVGENSADYKIEDYIDMDSLSLSYPNKKIKLKANFDHTINFETVGKVTVPVKIWCDELNISKIINVEVSVKSEPVSYSDKVELTYKTENNQIQYQLIQQLPKQYDPSFFPKSLDYEIVVPNKNYLSFMNFTKPSLKVLGYELPEHLYSYDKITHKLSLSQGLLSSYQGEELRITFNSQIDQNDKILLNFVKKTSSVDSLDLDTSINMSVTATQSPISEKDTKLYKVGITLNYPLHFTIASNNLAVIVGQKVGDYLFKDYVNETTAVTGLKILDSLLLTSLLTAEDVVITPELNELKVLMAVDLGKGILLKKEISIAIQPIEKKKYLVSMGEQFNKTDTKNANFYTYLNIPTQVNDIALPEQLVLQLNVTEQQASIMDPEVQKVEGIPIESYSISTDRKQVTINKENLKKYGNKEVKISWKTNMNYQGKETIDYFYDKNSHLFKMYNVSTVGIASYLISGNETVVSEESKTYDIAYDFKFKADALAPSFPSGTSTADGLDVNLFVQNIDVDYYKTGFERDFVASFPKEPILFEKVGSTVEVPITITSDTLGLSIVVKVPVLVTEELKLGFETIPKTLEINQLTTENGKDENNKKLYHLNSKDKLVVKDTRKVKSWRLSMIPSEINGIELDPQTKGKKLNGQFLERKGNKNTPLIASQEYVLLTSNKESEIVSVLWNEATEENGLFYANNTSSNYSGKYSGTITWQLSDVPE